MKNESNSMPDVITQVRVVEFFAHRYRLANGIKTRPKALQDELFWTLRQIKTEKLNCLFDKREPEIDLNGVDGFSCERPIPYDTIYAIVMDHLLKIVQVDSQLFYQKNNLDFSSKKDDEGTCE